MKVIILKTGEVRDVPLGFAVNFLLPKGEAVIATDKKLKELKQEKKQKIVDEKEDKMKNRQLAEKLDGKVVKMKVKAGKAGKIHGSITKKEIAKELDILKTKVILDKPIKKIGDYEIKLKFGTANAKIKLKVS